MIDSTRLPFNFYILVGARLISTFGTYLSIIAVNIFILQLTGSATWVAVVMAVKVLSGMLLSPFIGYISDRYNRKTLMIFSDLILTVAIFILVAVGDTYAKHYLIFLMFLTGVFSTLFEVCLNSAIPSVLGSQETLKANSIMMGGRNVMIALSGLLAVFANYMFKDYYSIFIVDAITYLISGVALIMLSIKTSQSSKTDIPKKRSGFIEELQADYSAVAQLDNFKVIMLFLCILLIDALASATHNVGFPIYSKMISPLKPMFYYGLIMSLWASGNLAGIYLLVKIPYLNSAKPEKLYMFFTALMSTGMIMIFQTQIPFIILISAFIAGLGDGTYQTYFTTYVQQVDDSIRGKVFALAGMVLRSGFGLGFIVVPLLLNYFSVSRTVLTMHSPVILVTCGYLLFMYVGRKRQLIGVLNGE